MLDIESLYLAWHLICFTKICLILDITEIHDPWGLYEICRCMVDIWSVCFLLKVFFLNMPYPGHNRDICLNGTIWDLYMYVWHMKCVFCLSYAGYNKTICLKGTMWVLLIMLDIRSIWHITLIYCMGTMWIL